MDAIISKLTALGSAGLALGALTFLSGLGLLVYGTVVPNGATQGEGQTLMLIGAGILVPGSAAAANPTPPKA